MRTVRSAAHGGPEVLKSVEAREPVAGPGGGRIAVDAAGDLGKVLSIDDSHAVPRGAQVWFRPGDQDAVPSETSRSSTACTVNVRVARSSPLGAAAAAHAHSASGHPGGRSILDTVEGWTLPRRLSVADASRVR